MNHASQDPHELISIVTPAYNEEQNLPAMYDRLCAVLDGMSANWEWIIVDDSSRDGTYAVGARLSARDPRVRAVRLSRNFGSHAAMQCALDHSRGACAIVMAGDLQDPPESIPRLLAGWHAGNHVVWAVRAKREGETRSTIMFSRFYHWMMRHVAGLKNTPATGADFLLLDRRVIEAVCQFPERNASIFALITWMGFRQDSILYDKQARLHGSSGWTLRKKIKLVIDSLTSFSYLPIRFMSGVGLTVSILGIIYGFFVLGNALIGRPQEGWTSLMVAVLFLGGGQMFMLGVLGEYIWRGLDESRRRPRYIIESAVGLQATDQAQGPRTVDVLASRGGIKPVELNAPAAGE